jgi:undecaprenyl-diphosphatase
MNDYILSLILGFVEGVTEFLPVSSTAHLRITQALMGLSLEDAYWKMYAIVIQLGAILAVLHIYRKRFVDFALGVLRGGLSPRVLREPAGLIGIAFVATCIPAFLLTKLIGKNLESIHVMLCALVVGGVIMIVVDLVYAQKGRTQKIEDMSPLQALWIGLVQTLSAVFPGTSRSMSTIAAGQLGGLTRSAALDFSFMVSVPVMIVATGYDLLKHRHEMGGMGMTGHQAIVLIEGFVISFVVAYVVVAWFLGYVRKHGFLPFGVYRIAVAALIYFFALARFQ